MKIIDVLGDNRNSKNVFEIFKGTVSRVWLRLSNTDTTFVVEAENGSGAALPSLWCSDL
jgi:hypothetical protein